ncbi:MAG TPA: zinc-binding alcohol dehydrogenase family protein [Verrucomicrobiae bacterium]|nr:zinc-binding alcohol dehydrogenase family protein [Verrucomicrobiae bacterium]
MRAIVIHQFGDPKQLKVEEVPTPEPRDGEVLVAVKAASINPSDVKNAAGAMHGTTLPRIPGRDYAGIVVRGDANLIGREVWGTGGDISRTRDGSHAEYILLPRMAVTPKSKTLSMEAAATAGLSFVTAWTAMVTVAGVSSGETVLVLGATGGTGSAAVQIARSRGARVIGAVRSDDDSPQVRQDGADEVINTRSANVVEAVHSLTNGRGAAVVFDGSGMMFAEAVEVAALDGRMPVIAAPADGKAAFNLRSLYRKGLRVQGIDTLRLDAVACAALLAEMTVGFESGQFNAKPGKPMPLAAAGEAYALAAHGGGRIVLVPDVQAG